MRHARTLAIDRGSTAEDPSTYKDWAQEVCGSSRFLKLLSYSKLKLQASGCIEFTI